MGLPQWHAGPVTIQDCLRETLLAHQKQMLHWWVCTDCDPDDSAQLMLLVVGWTWEEYLAEVMRRV